MLTGARGGSGGAEGEGGGGLGNLWRAAPKVEKARDAHAEVYARRDGEGQMQRPLERERTGSTGGQPTEHRQRAGLYVEGIPQGRDRLRERARGIGRLAGGSR